MYRAGPPAVPATGGGSLRVGGLTVDGLTVARAARRIFEGASPAASDAKLRRYLDDMVRPYGVTLRNEPFDQGCGQSYGEMAAALLAELTSADEPVDLLACAFTVGDVIPGRTTAAYLSDQCPGAPSGFAVCDQGIAAPYTALRLMTAYRATANCQRCVLVVTEQSAQYYDLPVPAAVPSVHAGVTLLLTPPPSAPDPARSVPVTPDSATPGSGRVPIDAVGAGAVSRLRAGVAESALPELLASEVAALSAGRDEVTLIIGGGLTSLRQGSWRPPAGWEVIAAPAGQPCTGTWWELAGCLDKWQGSGRRVLLADYDPYLRYLGAFGVDVQ